MPKVTLDDGLKKVIAAEAVAWVESVDKAAHPSAVQADLFAEEEYLSAAMVAKEMLLEQGRGLIAAVVRAIKTGMIPEKWDTADGLGELISTGLKQFDPRVAFQATLRSSYAAGREDRIASDPSLTHKVYRTMRDGRVRASHAVLNGVCLPVGDAFWDTHSAPNGWRCRCKCYGIDQEGIARLEAAGLQLQSEAPAERMVTHTNKFTGEKQTLPESVEPGWGWKPGSGEGAKRLAEMLKSRMNAFRTARITDF